MPKSLVLLDYFSSAKYLMVRILQILCDILHQFSDIDQRLLTARAVRSSA